MADLTPSDPRPRRAFSADERRQIIDLIRKYSAATVVPGSPPTGPAGGDLSGAYPNPSVVDDSHNHTAATLPATMPPSAHATSHQNGGGDEINVDGLSGLLADEQDPLDHAADHEPGGGDAMAVDAAAVTGSLRTIGTGALQACAGNDARLSDSRPPNGAAGGALDGTYPNPGLAASVAGAGLAESSDVLSVNVDTTSIEINSDTLRRTALTGDATATAGSSAVTVVKASGAFSLPNEIQVTVSADTDNWNPTGFADAARILVTVSTNDSWTLSGITAGAAGRILILEIARSSTGGLTLSHENTNSSAANRIHLSSYFESGAVPMFPGDAAVFRYDTNLTRWVTVALNNPSRHAGRHYGDQEDAIQPFTGVAGVSDGVSGAVPKPLSASGDDQHVLVGDGTWKAILNAHISASAAIALSKLANQATQTVIGRGDAGSGVPAACTFFDTGIAISTGEVFSVSGRLINIQYLLNGTTTYTPTTGTGAVVILGIAGGGGGGGAAQTGSQAAGAGGGGSGGWFLKRFTGVSGTYTVAIGAGGGGGAAGNNNGTAGNDTTFVNGGTTYTAKGGSGGTGMAAGTTVAYASGGAGGTVSTNGDVNTGGDPGMYGRRDSGSSASAGKGGTSPYGGGGLAAVSERAGFDGTGRGSGGGGAVCTGTTARAGGNGQNGILIIYEYTN